MAHRRSASLLLVLSSFAAVRPATAAGPTSVPAETGIRFDGFVLATLIINSGAVDQEDVPRWANPDIGTTVTGSIRQSRVGVTGSYVLLRDAARTPRLALEGRIAADFFGGFPDGGLGHLSPIPRLWVATIALRGRGWGLLLGQEPVLIAPLDPEMLSHVAIPGFAAAGNLWARQWQLQGYREFSLGPAELVLKAAVLAPTSTEGGQTSFVGTDIANGGEHANTPSAEGRVAIRFPTGRSTSEIGFAGHFGREKYRLQPQNAVVDMWAAALDVQLHLGRFHLLGEAFVGRDLAVFDGGIMQAARKVPLPADPTLFTRAETIRSAGGWVQVFVDLPAGFRIAAGAGIDAPREEDLDPGMRSLNVVGSGLVSYRIGPVELAAETEGFYTRRLTMEPQAAASIDLGARYRF